LRLALGRKRRGRREEKEERGREEKGNKPHRTKLPNKEDRVLCDPKMGIDGSRTRAAKHGTGQRIARSFLLLDAFSGSKRELRNSPVSHRPTNKYANLLHPHPPNLQLVSSL